MPFLRGNDDPWGSGKRPTATEITKYTEVIHFYLCDLCDLCALCGWLYDLQLRQGGITHHRAHREHREHRENIYCLSVASVYSVAL